MSLVIKKAKRRKPGFVQLSFLLIFFIAVASWLYIFIGQKANPIDLVSEKNIMYTKQFLSDMLGLREEVPAFMDRESWAEVLQLTFDTLVMSIMATGFATVAMLLTVIPAARTSANGALTLSRGIYKWLLYAITRLTYIFTRAVPELIYAMMIIFILKPGILPGAIALALHNFGILGKLCAEVIEDLDLRPIRSLSSSGAGKLQILFYGIIPTVMPKFITYIMYRWEVIIRTTIVVGFVGAGGLGQEFKLSMSWFHYSNVTLILICYIILVLIVDLISTGLRKGVQ